MSLVYESALVWDELLYFKTDLLQKPAVRTEVTQTETSVQEVGCHFKKAKEGKRKKGAERKTSK